MDPWDISGPAFLAVYAGLLAAVGLLVWVAKRRIVSGDDRGTVPHEPSPYEVAMLNEGPELVATVAATSLHSAGAIGPEEDNGPLVVGTSRKRHLAVVDRLPAGADPIDRDFYELVAAAPGRPAEQVRKEHADRPAVRDLRERMRCDGLIPSEKQLFRSRFLALLPGVLLALGVARLVAGISNDKPTLLLIILLFVNLYLLKHAWKRPSTTARGRELLRRVQARGELSPEIPTPKHVAEVALVGAGTLWRAYPAFAAALGVSREATGGARPSGSRAVRIPSSGCGCG